MAKSESEIIAPHITTIEALTGKKCEIKLVGKDEQILKTKSLADIETAIEKHNPNFRSIKVKGNYEDLVTLRKLFCLFASYAHSQPTISKHIGKKLATVRYYLRCSKDHLKTDTDFKTLFETIKADLIRGY